MGTRQCGEAERELVPGQSRLRYCVDVEVNDRRVTSSLRNRDGWPEAGRRNRLVVVVPSIFHTSRGIGKGKTGDEGNGQGQVRSSCCSSPSGRYPCRATRSRTRSLP
jgi:hypothetical protein